MEEEGATITTEDLPVVDGTIIQRENGQIVRSMLWKAPTTMKKEKAKMKMI